jgi:AcrR family transcriptional regulator
VARPHRPILSPGLIFTTALELIDRNGRFTVPELAQRLGVSVSSLYHHVEGRAGIVEGVRGLMTSGMASPPPDVEWPDAVRGWATSYRDAFAAHPSAIPLLVGQSITDPLTLGKYDQLADILEQQAGLRGDELLIALTMLDNLCLGAALDLGAPSEVWAVHDRDSALARALAGAQRTDRSRVAFDRQLDQIIETLAGHASTDPGGRFDSTARPD